MNGFEKRPNDARAHAHMCAWSLPSWPTPQRSAAHLREWRKWCDQQGKRGKPPVHALHDYPIDAHGDYDW